VFSDEEPGPSSSPSRLLVVSIGLVALITLLVSAIAVKILFAAMAFLKEKKMSPQTPILVATSAGQGRRPSDFCQAIEGELVTYPLSCDRHGHSIDDRNCGCRRSVIGLESGQSTTTFQVMLLPFGKDTLQAALTLSWQRSGWAASLSARMATEWMELEFDALLHIAAYLPIAVPLEIRAERIEPRI
jgi:hypothetical protein